MDKNLYKATNALGDFYVVTNSFDEAAKAVKELLDNANYGYSDDREVKTITLLASEHFFNGRQLFREDLNNLVIPQ